jgi:hypothetical protein
MGRPWHGLSMFWVRLTRNGLAIFWAVHGLAMGCADHLTAMRLSGHWVAGILPSMGCYGQCVVWQWADMGWAGHVAVVSELFGTGGGLLEMSTLVWAGLFGLILAGLCWAVLFWLG